MKIAVSKYSNRLFVAESKAYGRLATDSKAFTLTAAIGLKIYPSNMMFFKYRMFNRTYSNLNNVTVTLNYGDIVFYKKKEMY